MKLSKVYANNESFKSILFSEGFNVIFGDIEDIKNTLEDNKVVEHNLGKTNLLYLIDFLLLKKETKDKTFFGKYEQYFKDRIFFLEVKLNDGRYLTIKREINNQSKVSLKEHANKDQNYINETNRNYKNLAIYSKGGKSAKAILENNYLKFNINKDFPFRHGLSYLLRSQNDYLDVFRLNKFRGKDLARKPFLFKLLGYNDNLIKTNYDLDAELTQQTSKLREISGHKDNEAEIYKIKAMIKAKEAEKDTIQKDLDKFDFHQKELNINSSLVEEVEYNISKFNQELYSVTHRINSINQTLNETINLEVNLEDIKTIFLEMKIFIANDLIKQYEDVVKFTTNITKEREVYLKKELKALLQEQKKINRELINLNEERKEMLSYLEEEDTFKKYKTYQNEIIKVENIIFSYRNKLDSLEQVGKYNEKIEALNTNKREISAKIKEELDKPNHNYQNINIIFQNIYKTIFEYTATIIVSPNSKSNIEFEPFVLGDLKNITGKGDGNTSTRVLCMSFVLAVLINYEKESFFRFAYHDGILDTWGRGPKIEFFKIIREICQQHNVQYIISLIKSDVPVGFDLKKDEVVATLSKDNELFGFTF